MVYRDINLCTENRTGMDRLLGLLCVLSYPLIWIGSLGSLVGLPLALIFGNNLTAAMLVVLFVIAYVPHGNSAIVRSFYLRNCPNYFKECTLRIEEGATLGKDDEDPTVLAVSPHGIFSMGWGIAFVHPAFQHLQFCFSSVLLLSPAFRIFSKLVGKPGSASKDSIKGILKRRESWAIIPGGFEEATIHSSDTHRVYLKDRKGFLKYALQHGYSITPMYAFGENKTFSNLQGFWKPRLWLNSLGLPAIVPWGAWWCAPLMRSVPLLICVGTPFKMTKIKEPTKEQLAQHHAAYIQHFTEFFNRNNPQKGQKLEVW